MKKELTNFELINLINILNDNVDKKLPQKISYIITKNILVFQKELEAYNKSLNKLTSCYDDYIVKDENGKMMYNDNGIPMFSNKEKSEEFIKELNELLSIKNELNLSIVDEDIFDYDDSDKYDSLSAMDIIKLQSVLCVGGDNDDTEQTEKKEEEKD